MLPVTLLIAFSLRWTLDAGASGYELTLGLVRGGVIADVAMAIRAGYRMTPRSDRSARRRRSARDRARACPRTSLYPSRGDLTQTPRTRQTGVEVVVDRAFDILGHRRLTLRRTAMSDDDSVAPEAGKIRFLDRGDGALAARAAPQGGSATSATLRRPRCPVPNECGPFAPSAPTPAAGLDQPSGGRRPRGSGRRADRCLGCTCAGVMSALARLTPVRPAMRFRAWSLGRRQVQDAVMHWELQSRSRAAAIRPHD